MRDAIFSGIFAFHVHVNVNRIVLIFQPTVLVFKLPSRRRETALFFRTIHPNVARIIIRRFRNVVFARLTTPAGVWLFILVPPNVGVAVVIGVFARKTRLVFLRFNF